jgi:hypothetical protein
MTVGTFILDKIPKPLLLKSFDRGVVAWDFFWEIALGEVVFKMHI